VVGGGFTGLWTALRAVERDPSINVLLIEADRIAEHATGRNGGFCAASVTHGEVNGMTRWPDEYDALHRIGLRNLDEIEATIRHHGSESVPPGFAADVTLDLLGGRSTERTRLEMVRTQSLPFPPEPFAWIGVQLPRWSAARHDRTGKRNPWLRTLDRFGWGSTYDQLTASQVQILSSAMGADATRRRRSGRDR
jgi:glycine/D-amino acid oxidase-like deaminating enzyme